MIAMKSIKAANYFGYGRDSNGYLKKCSTCGKVIYMLRLESGRFAPFESWVAGNCKVGEWIVHSCSSKKPSNTLFNRISSSKRASVKREITRYCPKCRLALPIASKTCDYCGYTESFRIAYNERKWPS